MSPSQVFHPNGLSVTCWQRTFFHQPHFRRKQDFVFQGSLYVSRHVLQLGKDIHLHIVKLHFDSVHPDFFRKLKKLSAELTENDLRLCAYIRIGLRAKQIAEMLSVSPDSVNSNRYRLRKKFGLQRGDSLDDFIRRI